jgi:predicted PurR-regulated permease PerM
MKPLNDKEVKKGFRIFVLYLVILFGVSTVSIFFLIQTRKVQISETANQLDKYDEIQNKQILLSNKIDSLLEDMALLNTDKIQNSVFMQTRISYEKEQIEKLIQSSDSSHFLLYSKIIGLVNPMLVGKDSINSQLNREDFLKKSLFDCMHKYNDTKRKVDYNPVRFK